MLGFIACSQYIIDLYLMYDTEFIFYDDTIKIHLNKKGNQTTNIIIKIEEIKSYSINIVGGQSNYYEIDIIMNYGRNYLFTFSKTESNLNLIIAFRRCIQKFLKVTFNEISDKYSAGLLSTKKGLIIIRIYSLLVLIICISSFFFNRKIFFGSLITSVSILAYLYSTRTSQINLDEKLKQIN